MFGGRPSPGPAGGTYSAPANLLAGFKSVKSEGKDKGRRRGEKTGGDRQLREGTEEGGKEREGRRSGREWEKNGSRNLAGASKGTPGNAKYVTEILGDKNKEVRG